LLRRISFDITGLPPSPELVQKFVIDESLSTEAVIDQLLESPHFGERWARHWMDLARYAETYGHEFDYPIHDAWRYRDYLIRAFNADVPYDQFVSEHIAGDLLENPRRHPELKFNESVLATGFWFLGEATHAPVDSKGDEANRIDNQIDVMCRSFVGLTVACARCHDHKFDAISTEDYYAMSGFLQSSRRQLKVVDENLIFENAGRKIAGIQDRLSHLQDSFRAELTKADFEESIEQISSTEAIQLPAPPTKDKEYVQFPLDDSNWKTDGYAFGKDNLAPMIAGEAFEVSRPGTLSSASNGLKFSGVAHSSTFEIKHKFIHIRMKSQKARVDVVVDGVRMNEFNALLFRGLIHKDVNHDDYKWLTISGELYLHLGQRAWLEFRDQGEGYFAIDQVVFSSNSKPPKEPSTALTPEKIADSLTGIHANEIMSWVLKNKLDETLRLREIGDKIRGCHQEILEVNNGLPVPQTALAMVEGFPEDEFVFIRGNHKMKGKIAPRQFLAGIIGKDDSIDRTSGSGRLHLAKQIVDPSNPLTSRVIVNRVWHHLFGRGIVRSVDNFGLLGEKPSHPKLLDHLADEFTKDGWSIKRLVRKLMLTKAYGRSSSLVESASTADPDNIWLSRANVRRLQGEAIRDSMLVASNSLDRKMFGRSVPIHITPFMTGRGRPKDSGPVDGKGRRSIYIETRRNFLSPMMLAFDTPAPFNAIGMRTVSNVPAQALIMMNDPLVLEQAKRFADQVLKEESETESRIRAIWMKALSRNPKDSELKNSIAFLQRQAKQLEVEADSPKVWHDLCHVVFNLKEYIYLN
jgi:hypothetical protein